MPILNSVDKTAFLDITYKDMVRAAVRALLVLR